MHCHCLKKRNRSFQAYRFLFFVYFLPDFDAFFEYGAAVDFVSGLYVAFIRKHRRHKSPEQRVGPVGAGFQLRVPLGGYIEGMLRELAHLHNASVGGGAGEAQAVFRQDRPVIVVDLVAVAVPFVDGFLAVQLIGSDRKSTRLNSSHR